MQVKSLVSREYPEMEVVATNYPVPPVKRALARLAGYLQMGLLGLTLAGDKIFPWLGLETPQLYNTVRDNKFAYCMAIWFVGNAVNNALISTGAFEIFYDGRLVFSKLAQERMPMADEILRALRG
uniref:Selenoprotein t n=1 Tax=Tetraselmis sp. GSL018 TaxID=582737 RepID=A0A061R5R5_9CHLO